METIYDFVVETNKGVTYKLDAYKGDVMLIVNTARMWLYFTIRRFAIIIREIQRSRVCNSRFPL